MRIEWLDTNKTRARLSRGFLWWRKTAIVQRRNGGWSFEVGDNVENDNGFAYVGRKLDDKLDDKQRDAFHRQRKLEERSRFEAGWVRGRGRDPIPPARVTKYSDSVER